MTLYRVEARELHPVTGEPVGKWRAHPVPFDRRESAVLCAEEIERDALIIYKARIREEGTP